MKKIFVTMTICLFCFSLIAIVAPYSKVEAASTQAYLSDFLRLTTNPDSDRAPSWSPDGSNIVYHAFAGTWYRHIWVMNADGSGKKQLTFGNVVDESPDYSPNGAKIVFMRYGLRGGVFDLMTMNPDGTNIQQLTSSGLSRHKPKWSHDGQRLAFQYVDDIGSTTTNELHIMNADGSNEITLASIPHGFTTDASWSPDDTQIAYAKDDGIWVVNTSPPYEKTHLFTTSLPVTHLCFSPEGKHILYTRQSAIGQPQEDFYLITSSGNFVAQLTNDSKIWLPFDWSPNGENIAFSSTSSGNEDIWRAQITIAAGEVPLWGQWWFWTIVGLGAITIVFALNTFRHIRKPSTPKPAIVPQNKIPSKTNKVCPNCGANLPADSKFCGKCGTSLE